jgi:hypothetical protein
MWDDGISDNWWNTMLGGIAEDVDEALRMAVEDEMKETVIRLERLKAMSTRSKINTTYRGYNLCNDVL